MGSRIIIIFILVLIAVFGVNAQRAQVTRSGSVTVSTEPAATVWIDGILRGVTRDNGQIVIKPVSNGLHTLRVRAFGFKEFSQPFAATKSPVRVSLVRTNDRAEIAYQSAEQMMSEDKVKAIQFYNEAIKLRLKYPEAHLGLARAYSETGRFDEAHKAIRNARAARPVFPEASAVEGRLYRSEGEIDKAIESFERAIREGKGFQPEAHTGIALILKDEAEGAAAQNDVDLEKLYYEDAAASFEKAIDQLSATEPVVYLFLGEIYEKIGNKQKAIAVYQRFLRDMPDNEERTAVESFIVQLRKPQGS